MKNNYTYQGALEASERIGWRVEDIIGGEKRLDFSKPFMPESLAQVTNCLFFHRKKSELSIRSAAMSIWRCSVWWKNLFFPTSSTTPGRSFPATTIEYGRCFSSPVKRPSTFIFSRFSPRVRSRLRQQVRVHRSG